MADWWKKKRIVTVLFFSVHFLSSFPFFFSFVPCPKGKMSSSSGNGSNNGGGGRKSRDNEDLDALVALGVGVIHQSDLEKSVIKKVFLFPLSPSQEDSPSSSSSFADESPSIVGRRCAAEGGEREG